MLSRFFKKGCRDSADTMNQSKLPYLLIAIIACLVLAVVWLGYQRAHVLEQRNKEVQRRMDEWIRIIEMMNEQQQVLADMSQKQAEKKQIRMDVGKEIKEFNHTVKGIKQIEDPYESIKALDHAWAAR